ncbi:hypothetical protein Scep_016583 [Stephania cephalantha]|uniref:Uncharacterized protein n=1 Tax=Stephania cephalantha TaxID=152367 RepID=A0AAP0ING3_9MAGN
MGRGRRRRENREKREVSMRKKKNKMEGGEVWARKKMKVKRGDQGRGRERTELRTELYSFSHGEEVDGSPEPGRTGPGSEPKEDRKGKRKLEDFC